MPEEFIKHVKQLGKADQQPDLLTLYDRKGKSISKSYYGICPVKSEALSKTFENSEKKDKPQNTVKSIIHLEH